MEKPQNYISCCGFYCKTCKEFVKGLCKGCKIGYEDLSRDINKAKCKIKICCYRDKQLITCADCEDLEECTLIPKRFKPGTYSFKKCRECLTFIKVKGYLPYIEEADNWKTHYGKLK